MRRGMKQCPTCLGDGFLMSVSRGSPSQCHSCDGVGLVPRSGRPPSHRELLGNARANDLLNARSWWRRAEIRAAIAKATGATP